MPGEFGGGGVDPGGLGLSSRDLDLLADYLGGALADSPAEAEVTRLISDDPMWHRAHAALAEATVAVTADLGAWGRSAEPMPGRVAEQISAALAAASTPAESAESAEPAESADGAGDAQPVRAGTPGRTAGLSVVPGGRPARPPRRWTRWAAPIAAAAAVLAFCGFGLRSLPQGATDSGGVPATSLNDAAEGPAAAPEAGVLADLPIQQIIASDTDYGPENIGARVQRKPMPTAEEHQQYGPSRSTVSDASPTVRVADPALGRLTAAPALAACVAAVDGVHPADITGVDLADYAVFQGAPALILIFVDSAGARWAWAVGPDCGLPGAGADTLYQAKVG